MKKKRALSLNINPINFSHTQSPDIWFLEVVHKAILCVPLHGISKSTVQQLSRFPTRYSILSVDVECILCAGFDINYIDPVKPEMLPIASFFSAGR